MKYSFVGMLAIALASQAMATVFEAAEYGIAPGKTFDATQVKTLLKAISESKDKANILRFQKGVYNIGLSQCATRTWYISNHDQDNPKSVFLPLENFTNLTVEGNGAFFNLQARIIPFAIWDCEGVTLRHLTVDYAEPPLTQINISAVDKVAGTVTFKPLPGVKTEMVGTRLVFKGADWQRSPSCGILFEADGTIAYRTSDLGFNLGNVTVQPDGSFTAAGNKREVFKAGQVMALRTYERPAPGVVLSTSKATTLEYVTIYYADGMGVIAQACEDVTLTGVRVVPNAEKNRRFSTQADATHFSGCKGKIVSTKGEYVGMMDDAINVHGTYLKVLKRVDDRTLECAYMHPQAYGFFWGASGDQVQFVRSEAMDLIPLKPITLANVVPIDQPSVTDGAKRFHLTFTTDLPAVISPTQGALGVENLTWTPEVIFTDNIVAKNRARGALFSTPKAVVCEDNVFDHTSGCAILLCGDCNGWYETGACRNVVIRRNIFNTALTSAFQFTEAVISICPEIPKLADSKAYFHSGIVIEDNLFVTFDAPLVYAKSVDGLTIRNNKVQRTNDYPAWHWNKDWLVLKHVTNIQAETPKEVK